MGAPSGLQRHQTNNFVPGVGTEVDGNEVDVGAAVADVCAVGRAGGDAVPYLTALYERIGFCAIQGEDGNDGGKQNLPTSPTRARVRQTLGEHVLQEVGEKKTSMTRRSPTKRTGGFFEEGGAGDWGSSKRRASGRATMSLKGYARPSEDGKEYETGNEAVGGEATKGYSFANTPKARVTSVAERSPEVLTRLEALESQLEEERGNAEKWYKNVVNRVCATLALSHSVEVYFEVCVTAEPP